MLGLCSVLTSPGHGQPQRREMAWARITVGHRPESHIAEARPVSGQPKVCCCVNRASLCALQGAGSPPTLNATTHGGDQVNRREFITLLGTLIRAGSFAAVYEPGYGTTAKR